MALIDRQQRIASARTSEDPVLVAIPEDAFRARRERTAEVDRLMPMLLTRLVGHLRQQAQRFPERPATTD